MNSAERFMYGLVLAVLIVVGIQKVLVHLHSIDDKLDAIRVDVDRAIERPAPRIVKGVVR